MCLPVKAQSSLSPGYITGNPTTKMPACPKRKTVQRKSSDKTKKPLPLDFEPTEYSVICGNKKEFFNSVGNRRFRIICQMHVVEFMTAPSKHEKSMVVTKVMKALRDACPVGAFVAFEKGRWWQVSNRTSREKVGTFFRDTLSNSYKSSSKNKIAQRKKKRCNANTMPAVVQPQQQETRVVTPQISLPGTPEPTPILPPSSTTVVPPIPAEIILAPDWTNPLTCLLSDPFESIVVKTDSLSSMSDDLEPIPLEECDLSSLASSSTMGTIDPIFFL